MQELAEMTLTSGQFTTSSVVRTIQSCARINNEETESDRVRHGQEPIYAHIYHTLAYLDSDMSALALVNNAF